MLNETFSVILARKFKLVFDKSLNKNKLDFLGDFSPTVVWLTLHLYMCFDVFMQQI